MGEYATRRSDGQSIKIGTCEDMYYIRADQRHLVTPEQGSGFGIRFRFPWPDEDGTLPGEFTTYERAAHIHGLTPPTTCEHYNVQFSAAPGYLLSLPCPEVNDHKGLGRNGFIGAVRLVQLRLLDDGRLVPVMMCACGAKWRAEDEADILAIVTACRAEADAKLRLTRNPANNWTEDPTDGSVTWWHAVADRILENARLAAPEPVAVSA